MTMTVFDKIPFPDLKVLIYTRPWTKAYFHFLADRLFRPEHATYVSEHRWSESAWLMKPFYTWYKQYHNPEEIFSILSQEEVNSIIVRCRFLRSVERPQAMRMIYAMWKAIDEVLDGHNPDIIVGLAVDTYILDLMERVARNRGKPYIGLIQTFIHGFSRFTNRGELRIIREPSDEEVDRIYTRLLRQDYVPTYIKKTGKDLATLFLKYYLKDKVKKVVFWGRRVAAKDPLSLHHNAFKFEEKVICKNLSYIFPHRYFDKNWIARIQNAQERPKVYLPLQFYPETSTDYWCSNTDFIRFYDVLDKVLDTLAEDALVCVKEHPMFIGYRSPDVYRKLRGRKNVVLVPFNVPSSSVVELCDVVVTWGNTAGVEARLRGKPVITFGTPYYDVGGCFIKLQSKEDIDQLPRIVRESMLDSVECDGREVVRKILSGSFQGDFQPVYFSPSNAARVQEVLQVVKSIKKYIEVLIGSGLDVINT